MLFIDEYFAFAQGDKGWTGYPGSVGPVGNSVSISSIRLALRQVAELL